MARLFLFPLDSAWGQAFRSSHGHLPPRLSIPIPFYDHIKRMEGFSLEGCGRGRVFQAFAFRRGGDDAQWPESMGLWRILPTVAHPPLLTVSCLSQMLGLLARAPLCHIPGISSLTAVLASSFDFQFSHDPKLGFCLFLVTLS